MNVGPVHPTKVRRCFFGVWLLLGDIWESIRSGPARAGLSYLAVSIGIASLVVLGGVLNGLRMRARGMIQELGGNVLAIESISKSSSRRSQPLSRQDGRIVESSVPGAVVTCVRRYEIEESDRLRISILETDEHFAVVRGMSVARGRFLDRLDTERALRCAVVSEDLAELWRSEPGQTIRLQGEVFVVVGIVGGGVQKARGSRGGGERMLGERTVFVPYTVRTLWQPLARSDFVSVDAMFVQFPGNEDAEAWVPVVSRLLGVYGRDFSEWSWTTPQRLVAQVRRVQSAIRWAGGSIAFLSLLLGGTTLMSLMVANVRERVPEIGLRRALGATPRDIAALFVVEAWVIMLSAGATGLMLAAVLLGIIQRQLPVPFAMHAGMLVLPLGAALLLGTVFAYWPAAMAARISPAEALRND